MGKAAGVAGARATEINDRVRHAVRHWDQFAVEAGVGEASRERIGPALQMGLAR